VIETDLPILTSQSHTTIFPDHPRQTRPATPKTTPLNRDYLANGVSGGFHQ
ncbi:MAG: hypothetical protein QOE41_2920, partial [Mycobacterium sp.]|nr:hypothetical protein [Mycobacterium sp.]